MEELKFDKEKMKVELPSNMRHIFLNPNFELTELEYKILLSFKRVVDYVFSVDQGWFPLYVQKQIHWMIRAYKTKHKISKQAYINLVEDAYEISKEYIKRRINE